MSSERVPESGGLSEEVSLTYQVNREQWMRACEVHFSVRAGGGTRSGVVAGGLGVASGIALVVALGLSPLGEIVAVLGLLLLAGSLLRRWLWSRHHRIDPKFRAPTTTTFRDNAIEVQSSVGTSSLPWRFFRAYLTTPEFWLLYISKQVFSVVPRNCATEEQANRLDMMLKRYVGGGR